MPDQDALIDGLVRAGFEVMAVLNRIGSENELSLTQLRVLAILRDRRLRMSVLADYLGLEKSTLSGLADRAEKRDLLARSPNADDGRAVDVYLTAAGARLAERLSGEVAAALAPLTGALTTVEQQRLAALLDRMLATRSI